MNAENIKPSETPSIKTKRRVYHFKAAWDDIWIGIKSWRVWLLLGWLDLRLRYRRSYLGPFWITISMAIMIYSMGFVYGKLFHANLGEYFLYISGGMLSWFLLSTTLLEMMTSLTDAHSFILQVKIPFTIYILRVITRNFIVMAHNAIAIIPLLIYFQCMPNVLMLLFALFVTAISMLFVGMVFAMIGARFRDVCPVIGSILQVGFLLTPIMWNVSLIPGRAILAVYMNPFYYFVEFLRSSILNTSPPTFAMKGCISIAVGSSLVMFLSFARYRHRIPFWL